MSTSIPAPVEWSRDDAPAWPRWRLVGLRFAFVYVVLFAAPFPLYLEPVTTWIGGKLFDPIVRQLIAVLPWFAHVAFHLTLSSDDLLPTGSGDRPVDWVSLVLRLLLAAIGCAILSLAQRKKTSQPMLAGALKIYVRWYLASIMFTYGFAKVIAWQFVPPDGARLVEPVGDLSPMGLMWTFMGFSHAYSMFAGAGELLGGALLLFRRTTTAGALVVIAVMSNVLMMNLCYDVPVKIESFHFLLFAIALVALDGRRLVDVFLRGRAVDAVTLAPRTRATRAAKIGLLAILLFAKIGDSLGETMSTPPLGGVYSVAGDPSIVRIGIGRWALRVVRTSAAPSETFGAMFDDPQTIVVRSARAGEEHLAVTTRSDDGTISLTGTLDGKPVALTLTRIDTPLQMRGFHWVQPRPMNR